MSQKGTHIGYLMEDPAEEGLWVHRAGQAPGAQSPGLGAGEAGAGENMQGRVSRPTRAGLQLMSCEDTCVISPKTSCPSGRTGHG